MYGVTDHGFVYRNRDLQSGTVQKSMEVGHWNSQNRKRDWRKVIDSSLSPTEQAAAGQMVVGYPVISHVKEDRHKSRNYDVRLPSSIPTIPSDRIWRVRQMELVSLLKHDPPVAYEDRQPIMMNAPLREPRPTRSLNEMEVASLEALEDGKDRVFSWDSSEERLQMLGAIRAKDSCLKCHEVKRGDLLGAFTYWIEEEDRKTPNQTAASQDEAQ
jgi:hypothetical protein